MIDKIRLLLALIVAGSSLLSCGPKTPSADCVYEEVTIGKQVWMGSNLNVDRFRNGDRILEAKTQGEWKTYAEAGKPAWCYYDYKESNGKVYGKLYNWYAVNDSRKLAPTGWHVASESEWSDLTEKLDGAQKAGERIKGKTGWNNNGNGNNRSGFNGLPAGSINSDGNFSGIGLSASWWSATKNTINYAWNTSLNYFPSILMLHDSNKGCGYSVRCIKD